VVTAFMSSAMIPNGAQAMEIWRFDRVVGADQG
jgi:hypothetical protein